MAESTNDEALVRFLPRVNGFLTKGSPAELTSFFRDLVNAHKILEIGRATFAESGMKKNFELLEDLGSSNLIDYQNTSLESLNEKFDIIFDLVGNLKVSKFLEKLNPLRKISTCCRKFA